MNLENIGGVVCEPLGGTGVILWWGLHADFESIKGPKDICSDSGNSAANFTELAVISESHTMKAGKKLHKVIITSETGSIKSVQIGEKKRRLFENSITGELPGSEAEKLGFARYIKNQDLIVFVQEFGSSNIRQLGSAILPAWAESQELDIEAAVEGKNANALTFKDKWKGPAPIYTGNLDSLVATDSE
jgi:hypothetical protein